MLFRSQSRNQIGLGVRNFGRIIDISNVYHKNFVMTFPRKNLKSFVLRTYTLYNKL